MRSSKTQDLENGREFDYSRNLLSFCPLLLCGNITRLLVTMQPISICYHDNYIKVGVKGRFQSFIEFAFSVLLETRKSLLYVQSNKITISSLKVFLEGF